jgi:hypothetical protein
MRTMPLTAFVQRVEDRKQSLGVTDEDVARARNSGRRRTSQKRELLARTQERARNSGLEPIPANF